MTTDDSCLPLVAFFEQLTPESLTRLGEFYTEDAYFKDPFNEVRNLAGIRQVFDHMFATLDGPRFVVTERIVQGAQCFLVWEFHFRLRSVRRGIAQTVRGGSHLRFAADGRISYHRDYWDAAEELYEKLPLLGTLMRFVKRQVKA